MTYEITACAAANALSSRLEPVDSAEAAEKVKGRENTAAVATRAYDLFTKIVGVSPAELDDLD